MTTDTPNAAVSAYLDSIRRVDANGLETFHDPIFGPFIDTSRADCPAMDASAVAAWTRVNRRDLWSETQAKPAAPAAQPSTAADAM